MIYNKNIYVDTHSGLCLKWLTANWSNECLPSLAGGSWGEGGEAWPIGEMLLDKDGLELRSFWDIWDIWLISWRSLTIPECCWSCCCCWCWFWCCPDEDMPRDGLTFCWSWNKHFISITQKTKFKAQTSSHIEIIVIVFSGNTTIFFEMTRIIFRDNVAVDCDSGSTNVFIEGGSVAGKVVDNTADFPGNDHVFWSDFHDSKNVLDWLNTTMIPQGESLEKREPTMRNRTESCSIRKPMCGRNSARVWSPDRSRRTCFILLLYYIERI